jgi:hypothetical protein
MVSQSLGGRAQVLVQLSAVGVVRHSWACSCPVPAALGTARPGGAFSGWSRRATSMRFALLLFCCAARLRHAACSALCAFPCCLCLLQCLRCLLFKFSSFLFVCSRLRWLLSLSLSRPNNYIAKKVRLRIFI